MHRSFFTSILILFCTTFALAAAVADQEQQPASDNNNIVLTIRQTTNLNTNTPAVPATGSNSPQCIDYSRTANLSTIGANSTYRSAFLQASPAGTIGNARMLNAAIAKLPALTRNASLNAECGNLTTIAFVEAEKNFSIGTVAQFSGLVGNPQEIINAGPHLAAIMVLIIVVMMGVFSFAE